MPQTFHTILETSSEETPVLLMDRILERIRTEEIRTEKRERMLRFGSLVLLLTAFPLAVFEFFRSLGSSGFLDTLTVVFSDLHSAVQNISTASLALLETFPVAKFSLVLLSLLVPLILFRIVVGLYDMRLPYKRHAVL